MNRTRLIDRLTLSLAFRDFAMGINKIDLAFLKESRPHFPVLIQEVLESLNLPRDSDSPKVYLDCTFGAGGYSSFILKNSKTKVIAIDRDESVSPLAHRLSEEYPDRFLFYQNTFSEYPTILKSLSTKS